MRTGKYLILLLAVMALLVGTQKSSHALSVLSLQSGIDIVLIMDNGPYDATPLPHVVTYVGPVGPYWNLNVTTGTGGGYLDPTTAYMDLNDVSSSSTTGAAPQPLIIQFTQTDFIQPLSSGTFNADMEVSGTIAAGGTALFDYYLDKTNAPLGTFVLLGELGPFSAGGGGVEAFSGGATGSATGVLIPFSLTLVDTITHPGGEAQTSFDQSLTAGMVPEPSTMLLLGLGLIGVAGVRRKFKK